MISFSGKNVLVLGVANDKSIAWSITKAVHEAGGKVALTYVNEAIEKRVRPLASSIGCELVLPCDVQDDKAMSALASHLQEAWGRVDCVVHSVAYAEREDLQNRFVQTTREGFRKALDVSAYSLISVLQALHPLFTNGGSVITMTYLGSERVVQNYNVMGVAKAALECCVRYLAADLGSSGIRVNALSAGPIKTLAASGIPQFRQMLAEFAEKAPLKRNVSLEDVANTAAYLLSDLSSGVTGEVLYVDCGFNTMGM